MINKKIIQYLIVSVFLLSDLGVAYAKNGSGEVIMSQRSSNAFYNYLNHKKGPPLFFALHPDGDYYSFWYCPREYAQGCNTSSGQKLKLIKQCNKWAEENNVSGRCFMFAQKNTIVWKNSANKKKLKIPKKLSEDQLKQFLFENKFLTAAINTPTFNLENPDLLEKIKGLQKLYDQGALTKKDFERAKKAILKK